MEKSDAWRSVFAANAAAVVHLRAIDRVVGAGIKWGLVNGGVYKNYLLICTAVQSRVASRDAAEITSHPPGVEGFAHHHQEKLRSAVKEK